MARRACSSVSAFLQGARGSVHAITIAQLLVGNFGNGRIHAYGLFSGRPAGTLRTKHHKPITIDGLWALQFGTATTGGTGTLLFSAGLNDEADGLVGAINPAR